METKQITIAYQGRDYPVDVTITYEGIDAHIKVRTAGKEFELIPTVHDGLQIIPEDTGLDNQLVYRIAMEVLKGLE